MDQIDERLIIKPMTTNKSNIKQRPAMEQGIIPKHPSTMLFAGKSGSGKTQLLINLLSKPEFYGPTSKKKIDLSKPGQVDTGYWDLIVIFSETAGIADDLYDHLKWIPKEHIMKPTIIQLEHIINTQKGIVSEKGVDKAPKILLIFDDIAHHKKLLASDAYLEIHILNRHLGISVMELFQSYVKCPRSSRIQVNAVFAFKGTNTEFERLCSEHCPSMHSDKEFQEIVAHAQKEPYSFIFVNKKAKAGEQYRKNLTHILKLHK